MNRMTIPATDETRELLNDSRQTAFGGHGPPLGEAGDKPDGADGGRGQLRLLIGRPGQKAALSLQEVSLQQGNNDRSIICRQQPPERSPAQSLIIGNGSIGFHLWNQWAEMIAGR